MPQNSRIKLEGWHQLMMAFGLSENNETYHRLLAAYSEKHRAYHTIEHIDACFGHLDTILEQSTYPHEIELALWFHDVIYKPFSATNEEESANLAKEFLSQNSLTPETVKRINDLIILTKDHVAPQSIDGELMLDIDLSVLGAEKHIYTQFEKNVRREYKQVPSFLFNKKRKEILKSFVKRPRLYHTAHFFERLENQAKINLTWAINNL